MPGPLLKRPEILAPAGDRDALAAALAAGADAIYFGLDDGFNARARAENFPSTGLPEVVAGVHRGGARVYVTLNTLVFEPELATVEELIRRVAAAGVDAIIVQDPAVALLARRIAPGLEVHASTQMTASSPLAVSLLASLGLSRVVVPRELSVDEIRAYRAGTPVELEVFVHGALCVAWSGQCLSSEAWGGRSANRGQCAQACRLPYALVVDGETRDLGEVEYLLSPKDLVGLDAIAELAQIGVTSLKIEGRLKGPAYVAMAVSQYRAAVDPSFTPAVAIPSDRASLEIAYSRGSSAGFLAGADHQTLVEGRFPRHRGLALGRVTLVDLVRSEIEVVRDATQRPITGGLAVAHHSSTAKTPATPETSNDPDSDRANDPVPFAKPDQRSTAKTRATPETSNDPDSDRANDPVPFGVAGVLAVDLTSRASSAPSTNEPETARIDVVAGMGVVFDAGTPEQAEQGGPIFAVAATSTGHRLRFGNPGPDLSRVRVGDFVWINSDPRITTAGLRATEAGRGALGRIPVDLVVSGAAGQALEVRASATRPKLGFTASGTSLLAAARGAGLTRELIADKLGAFGGTPFRLGALDLTNLAPSMHLPVSELKELRRALVTELDAQLGHVDRSVEQASVIEEVRATVTTTTSAIGGAVTVIPLCRTDEQLDAVLDAGARDVELDWMELVGLQRALVRARARGAKVTVATVRVQKPGEEKIDAHLERLEPDAVLVRSWGSLAYFKGRSPLLHGDFSLNVTNAITAGWVLGHGLATLTAAHDLDRDQLLALLAVAPRGRIAVTVHHHIPTFHTEHCVYAHLLSHGRDYRTCGRPCETHQIALRDRVGLVHPVNVDVGCRNTVFNAQAQSAAALVPELLAAGVCRLRVELVRESAAETARLYDAYVRLAAGQISAADAVRAAAAHEQYGVTRGTMRTLTVLR